MMSESQLEACSSALTAQRRPIIPPAILDRARRALKDQRLRTLLGLPGSESTTSQPKVPSPAPSAARPIPSQTASQPRRNISATAIHRNAFNVLGVTTRDSKQQIIAAAERGSLLPQSSDCERARGELINLRTRVAAELAWLPGVSPKRASDLLRMVGEAPEAVWQQNGLPPLAHANLIAAALESPSTKLSPDQWAERLVSYGWIVEGVELSDVLRDINEDRAVAKLSLVRGIESLEGEYAARARAFRDAAKSALAQLETRELVEVMKRTVDAATASGTDHGPLLIDELVDAYALESSNFLEKEKENLVALIEHIGGQAANGERAVSPLLDRLAEVLTNWDSVAQPIQVSMRSRGMRHDLSFELAHRIRSMGVDLANNHGMFEAAKRITRMLQGAFEELDDVSESLAKDADTLDDLLVQKQEAERHSEAWAREITYSAQIGILFKDTLSARRQLSCPLGVN